MRPTTVLLALALAVAAAPCAAQRPAPWTAAELRALRDNQPRSQFQAHAEYGGYLSASIGGIVQFDAEHSFTDDSASTTVAPGASAILALPALRVGVVFGAGALLGAPVSTPLLWHARGDLRLGAQLHLRARAERVRYTATAASIDTLVLARAGELMLDRSAAPGWAAAAAARHESFGDGNAVRTAYAWLLAPLSRSAAHALRAGYAASWQDARESRWQPAPDQRPPRGPFATPGALVPGVYDPYYTPHDQLAHSLVADAALATGAGWLKLNAAAAVRARELAPQRRSGGAQTPDGTLQFAERTYTPWRITTSWWTPVSAAASVTLEAEYSRTAYYGAARARVGFARTLRGS